DRPISGESARTLSCPDSEQPAMRLDAEVTKKGLAAMRVGVPKEVKNHEYRVAITPAGVLELTRGGHEVFIERDAGTGSTIPDEDFVIAGAVILPTADDVWDGGQIGRA